MRVRPLLLITVLLAGSAACVHPVSLASRQTVSLRYVGTISFGEPSTRDGHTVVPFTLAPGTGEWSRNSAHVLYGTTARQHGSKIEFSVLTSLPPGNDGAPRELRLPRLAAGDYTVVYVDPDSTQHDVGKITVRP